VTDFVNLMLNHWRKALQKLPFMLHVVTSTACRTVMLLWSLISLTHSTHYVTTVYWKLWFEIFQSYTNETSPQQASIWFASNTRVRSHCYLERKDWCSSLLESQDALTQLWYSRSIPKLLYTLRTSECHPKPILLEFDIVLKNALFGHIERQNAW